MDLPKDDVYPSHVASFPVESNLRGGHWIITLTVSGLPGNDQLGQWNCVLPGYGEPQLPPGQLTIVTFQENPDGTAPCTTEAGSLTQ